MVSRADFTIVLLLLQGPLAMRFKESSLGLGGLNAYVSDYEQISDYCWHLQDYLLHSHDITDPVMEGIDDFDVLDVWDNVLCSPSSCFCLMVFRVSAVDGRSYVP
jgi:hypothetical protein